MTYQLYDGLQTGGAVVRAVLSEIGVPYEVVTTDIRTGIQNTASYAAVNPRQQVPALVFPDGQVMTETSAIIVHLADCHQEAELIPPLGSAERGQALRWLAFCATNLYEGESRKLNPARYTTCEPEGVARAARNFVDRNYLVLEAAFDRGPYLFEENICVTDIFVWMLAQWHHDFEWLKARCPRVLACVSAVMERPAVAMVHEDQFGSGLGLKPLPPLDGTHPP